MQDFLAKVNPKQKRYFSKLRAALRSFPELEEAIEIDDVSGEWCPAYRVKGSDLVWAHFDERLWINFPVEPVFEKKVLQDESLDTEVLESVREAENSGDTKWAKIDLTSVDRVEKVIPLLKLRHSVLLS